MKAYQASNGLNSLFWPTLAWMAAWRMVALPQQEATPMKKPTTRKSPAAARPAYNLGNNVVPFPLEKAERRKRQRIRTDAEIIRFRSA